ncbi:MAG: hypothetical protein ACYC46_13610 [Acidobacteriaceae bacterium]
MRILFAIFVLCLCALLWATYAITRHIHRQKQATGVHADGDEHLGFHDLGTTQDAATSAVTSNEL